MYLRFQKKSLLVNINLTFNYHYFFQYKLLNFETISLFMAISEPN